MQGPEALFHALELAHYAERYRGRIIVAALPLEAAFGALHTDIRVLAAYQIRLCLVLSGAADQLSRHIEVANGRGGRFHLVECPPGGAGEENGALDAETTGRLTGLLAGAQHPVISVGEGMDGEVPTAFRLAMRTARAVGARKVVLVTPLTGGLCQTLGNNAVLAADIHTLPHRVEAAGGTPPRLLLECLAGALNSGVPDIVLLEGTAGQLYQEVFTYDGAGLLFTRQSDSRVRPARLADVTDIALLLRPEMEAGRLLRKDQAAIEANISNYRIYEIDGMPVGVACLRDYGEAAELGQFTTLSRFRGKGRARELAHHLIEEARTRGYRRLFALTTDPRMAAFFRALQFLDAPRESLPEKWRAGYDLTRPSQALVRNLEPGAAAGS